MLCKCKRKGCKNKFAPRNRGRLQVFCCHDCCIAENNRLWRLEHPGPRELYIKSYRDRSLQLVMFWTAKGRATKKHFEFNIDAKDIIIPEFCPVLGIRLETKRNKATRFTSSPSLDRIDSTKGYVKGNVRVISARANCLKNNATIEELERVLADLKATSGGHNK